MSVSDLISQGEHRHRVLKGMNSRTNRNNAIPQIIKMDVRHAAHVRIENELKTLEQGVQAEGKTNISNDYQDTTTESANSLDKRYHIAKDEKNSIFLGDLVDGHKHDRAFQVYHAASLLHPYSCRFLGFSPTAAVSFACSA
jgi:hypothetical protein